LSTLKKLAGQTVIYGLSSILARFFNYLLVPLHIAVFSTDQFGIITEMYAYVAFLVVLLTYGMETAYFRFSNKEPGNNEKVFTTTFLSLLTTSSIFIFTCTIFSKSIGNWLHYPNNSEYVIWFAIIVSLDALTSIPLAKLRAENKAKKFALINIVNVLVNILLNIFFFLYCLPHYKDGDINWVVKTFYNPEIGVGYVFISNLVASIVKLILVGNYFNFNFGNFSASLLKNMLKYSMPLLIAGLAGMVNETIDRIMLKNILWDTLGEKETMSQLGIYGAAYKLSIIITLSIQAYRYAAEPFFFKLEKNANAKETYARIMNYFTFFLSLAFLTVTVFIDFFKYLIPNTSFWQGLQVVPILLMANVFLGLYLNQSIWYKLTNQTKFGSYLSIGGALITILLNYLWIPIFGYVGSAWATLICYGSMMIGSYILGQKYYPIPYKLSQIFFYIGFAFVLFLANKTINIETSLLKYSLAGLSVIVFIYAAWAIEKKDLKPSLK
jgi:O-antigen/teichoic acid export membrane protein